MCRSGLAPGDVEVAIDPAELEGLDDAGVRALYEERLAQQRTASSREVWPLSIPLLLFIWQATSCFSQHLPLMGAPIYSENGGKCVLIPAEEFPDNLRGVRHA